MERQHPAEVLRLWQDVFIPGFMILHILLGFVLGFLGYMM